MISLNRIVPAAKAVLLHQHKILLLKRSSLNGFAPGSWEFPGGKMEYGESPESALRREVREETGLDAEVGRILYAACWPTSPRRQALVLCYLCTAAAGEVRLSWEHRDFFWADKDQVAEKLSGDPRADWLHYNLADLPELQ